MMANSIVDLKDFLHAQLCYQLFITPVPIPLKKTYRVFSRMACDFLEAKRSQVLHRDFPRHHVIHHLKPIPKGNNKKILITHGWLSRAAYMVRLIRALHLEGYEVYALDFPAHGEAKGVQLPWSDASAVIRHTLNEFGPFYGAIGHSFGGSMLLNTLNLAGQMPQWGLEHQLERAVLIASPTNMRNPVNALARKFKLSGRSYLYLRELFHQNNEVHHTHLSIQHFVAQNPNTPFLCIHGEDDHSISPQESISFCNEYKNASLSLLKNANHISVLIDKRVEQLVSKFFLESVDTSKALAEHC
jgi:pimeloyl-ACP methyl ester carboxylesterase